MSGTGAKAYLGYGIENTFKTPPADVTNVFGREQNLTNVSSRNEAKRLYDIGTRESGKIEYLGYEGVWSIECVLADHGWMEALFGSLSGSTYDVAKDIKSMTIEYGIDESTDIVRELKGSLIRTGRISTRINEEVRVALDGVFAIDSLSSSLGSAPASTVTPYTFEGASIELPQGSTLSKVQTLELTFNNNPEYIKGLGSRFAVDKYGKEFVTEGRFSLVFEDDKYLQYLYDGAGSASTPQERPSEFNMEVTLDSDSATMTINLDNCAIEEVSHSIAPNELIVADVSFVVRQASVDYV